MTICERNTGGRILCIRLSGLGDVVHALNALSLLRQERPDAHITWLVEDRFSGLLRRHPCIDELITVPRQVWGVMLRDPFRWYALGSELKELAGLLRERRFDISVDFQSSLKSAWLVAAAGAALRIGFGGGVNRELNRLVQNHLVTAPTEGVHRIERNLALLAPLGIPTRYADPLLPRREADAQALDEALAGRLTGGPLVVIHPGTSKSTAFKRWMPERYARVADRLAADRGADVVVSYGPDDRELAEQVVACMRRRGILAPPTRGPGGLIHLLDRADLFMGSDTGPMHIASALKVPIVALFGPKDPVQTGPYCSRSVVVTGRAPCRPCTRRRCSHARCMTSITVGHVLQAALEVLDGGGERRAKEGPIRAPFTYRFSLGEWRGRIATCYSVPEFYTQLCDPDGIVRSGDARVISLAAHRLVVSFRTRIGGTARRLVARRCYPELRFARTLADLVLRSRARNSWECARRLELRGASVPFHVCYMDKGRAWSREQFLLTEELAGGITLREWLASDDRRSPVQRERNELTRAIAGAIRSFHMAGYWHADLRDASILVSSNGNSADSEVRVIGFGRARRIGWVPPMLREIFYGLDLAGFALSLETPPSALDRIRFLRAYCRGFIEGPRQERLLQYVVSTCLKRHEMRRGREESLIVIR